MSADLLRKAATSMRNDHGEDWQADLDETPFFMAVADWLVDTADLHTAEGNPGKEPHSCSECGWGWPCAMQENAITVARTYLGVDAP